MASNFVARSFGGVARPKIVEAKPKAVALRKAPSSGLPPIISEKARLGALLAGEAESAARMQTQVKALQLQIAPAVQSERTATGGKPVPAGKLEAWLREAAARFDHVASLSVQPSREARRAQLIAEVGPRPASFDDSIAIHSFKPKLRLGSSSKTAVFDRALSEAIAGYRPEQDLGLQRAGGASLETRGVTLASLPGAGRYPVRASAVASRIAGVNLSEHLRALLMQAAGSAAGPAGEPLLRPVQALASAIVLSAARAPVKAHLERTLAAAQNEVEQALIIKSIGARAARLMTNDEHNNAAALGEIDAFSTMIRGAPVSLVLDRSSMLVATDSTRFDSIKQQAGNTCVAASSLACMGSADPVISWLFKAGGRIDAWNATGLGARLERAILTSDLSGPRGTTWDLPKSSGGKSEVDSIATTAAKEGHLTEAEGKAIDSLLSNWRLSEKMRPFGLDGAIEVAEQLVEFRKLQGSFSTLFPEAETGLAKLRALHPAKSALLFDGPTLMEWTKFPEGGPKGIDPDVAGNTFVSQRTHLDYNRVKYRYRLEGDPHHAERLAQVIEAGQPVLLRRGDPEDMPYNYSHCLSALDVRGEPGRREFLVADSMPGSARWISEEEFDFSYFFGHSYPTLGVGRRAAGRPEL